MSIFGSKTRQGAVICGAYGQENAGDDAVLSAILQELRRLDKNLPITVMARKSSSVARKFGVTAVHPLRIFRWLAAMGRAALFISGGGSLLQDVTSQRSLWYYLATIALAKKCGCAVQLYGCGIGPLLRERSRSRTARVLNACADANTLRDEDSLALLQKLGVTAPRLLLAADPALRLPPAGGEREPCFGIVLRPWPELWAHIPDFAAAARHAWETYRLPAVLLCLAPEDRVAAGALIAALEEQAVPCSVRYHTWRAAPMSLVLSLRLHGLIFALRDGTPAAGVSYDPKVSAFCRDAGFPWAPLHDATAEALCRLIDEAVHLDTEALSVAAETLRERERVSARTAAELLAAHA